MVHHISFIRQVLLLVLSGLSMLEFCCLEVCLLGMLLRQTTLPLKLLAIHVGLYMHSQSARSYFCCCCCLPYSGYNGAYVPLLVDNLDTFLEAFEGHDFQGFSVTIPHKEAALKASASTDPVAAQIGAVNTLIKQQDGSSFKGYNTDWIAAITAIENALATAADSSSSSSSGRTGEGSGVLQGKRFLVIGAGGAGKALAFGAASKGAKVMIMNRNEERARVLAEAVPGGAEVVGWEEVQGGRVGADVVANTTSVGMVPDVEATPVPADAVGKVRRGGGVRGRRREGGWGGGVN